MVAYFINDDSTYGEHTLGEPTFCEIRSPGYFHPLFFDHMSLV